MAAADAVEAWGKSEFRRDTERGLGKRMGRTWKAKVYPERGARSLAPSVVWYTKAPHIVSAFSQGAEIRSKNGFWLAIPTENAAQAGRTFGRGSRMIRGRQYAINETERRYGRLRYVFLPGRRVALLVADGVRRSTGRTRDQAGRRYRRATAAARRRGDYENGVVMFVLVPHAKLTKRINPDAIGDRIGREGMERWSRAFSEVTARNWGES